MKFGDRVRELRAALGLGQRAVAERVGVCFTYISKIETEKLDFGDYPSEELILRLAAALDADADELLLLAQKVPPRIRERVLQRPDAFRRLAELDDPTLDRLLRLSGGATKPKPRVGTSRRAPPTARKRAAHT